MFLRAFQWSVGDDHDWFIACHKLGVGVDEIEPSAAERHSLRRFDEVEPRRYGIEHPLRTHSQEPEVAMQILRKLDSHLDNTGNRSERRFLLAKKCGVNLWVSRIEIPLHTQIAVNTLVGEIAQSLR